MCCLGLWKAERDVVQHTLPGKQPRFLEHDPRIAMEGGLRCPVERNRTGVARLQPRDEPQQRALAATATAHDGDEFARAHVQFEPREHSASGVALVEPRNVELNAADGVTPRNALHDGVFDGRGLHPVLPSQSF